MPRSLQERRCGDGTANLLTDFLYSFWCSGTIELRSRTREEGKILHKLKYHQYTLHDTDPTLAATAGAAASSAAQAPTGIGAASEIKPYRQQIERGWKLFHIVGLTTSQTYDGRALSYEVASKLLSVELDPSGRVHSTLSFEAVYRWMRTPTVVCSGARPDFLREHGDVEGRIYKERTRRRIQQTDKWIAKGGPNNWSAQQVNTSVWVKRAYGEHH